MSLVETLPTPETATWCESGTVGDGGSNPGDIDPSGGDIAQGWPATSTPPPRQRFNWLDNLTHKITRYFRQQGLPEWNVGETYPPGALVKYGGYVRKQIGLGNVSGNDHEPDVDHTNWITWPVFFNLVTTGIGVSAGSSVSQAMQITNDAVREIVMTVVIGGSAAIVTLSGDALFTIVHVQATAVTADTSVSVPSIEASSFVLNVAALSGSLSGATVLVRVLGYKI
jgi:hypothetical protein